MEARAFLSTTLNVPNPTNCTLLSRCRPCLDPLPTPGKRRGRQRNAACLVTHSHSWTKSIRPALFIPFDEQRDCAGGIDPASRNSRLEQKPMVPDHGPVCRVAPSTGKLRRFRPRTGDARRDGAHEENSCQSKRPPPYWQPSTMPRGVMVAQVTLNHFVKVRVLARQPTARGPHLSVEKFPPAIDRRAARHAGGATRAARPDRRRGGCRRPRPPHRFARSIR